MLHNARLTLLMKVILAFRVISKQIQICRLSLLLFVSSVGLDRLSRTVLTSNQCINDGLDERKYIGSVATGDADVMANSMIQYFAVGM